MYNSSFFSDNRKNTITATISLLYCPLKISYCNINLNKIFQILFLGIYIMTTRLLHEIQLEINFTVVHLSVYF